MRVARGVLSLALVLALLSWSVSVKATETDIDTESGIDLASNTVVEELSVDDAAGLIEDVEAEDEEIELSIAADEHGEEDTEEEEAAAEQESQAEEAAEAEEAEEEADAALIEADAAPALKNTAEPSYYGKAAPSPAVHVPVEYGDPFPAKTAALAAATLKNGGKSPGPTVFKTSFLTPGPTPKQHIRCYGKPGSDAEKCYRVDRKTGVVIGRQNHLPLAAGRTGKYVAAGSIETPGGHIMNHNGFQTPEYDDKLSLWKPLKHKRSLSPAPVVSLLATDAQVIAADALEQEQAGTEWATEATEEEEEEAEAEPSSFVETERKKKKDKKKKVVQPKSAFGWKKSARKNAKCACKLLQRHNSNSVKACKHQCTTALGGVGCNAVNYNSVTAICDLRVCDADVETGAVKLLKTASTASQCYWYVKPPATVAAPTPAVVTKTF